MSLDLSQRRKHWRELAQRLTPSLRHWNVSPLARVALRKDASAWQGVAMEPLGAVPPALELSPGETAILDFGEHLVGEVELAVGNAGQDFDSPVMLRFLAAETPYELSYRREDYQGGLAVGWMQEETSRVMSPSPCVRLPNRMALRYLLIEALSAPGRAALSDIRLRASSAVGAEIPPPPPGLDGLEQKIHQTACRTLRNCMQGVFEDGPKRDRRLWLGDLRLQALANAVTYRNAELVERSLYLLAADTGDDGLFPSCAFETDCGRGCHVLEYPLLLAPLLLEHLRAYGRREIAEDLFDLAAWQFHLLEPLIGLDGLMRDDHRAWLVIDHSTALEKETALQGVFIFALEALAALARELGRSATEAAFCAERLREALRRHRLDGCRKLFFSGKAHQFSVASQVWAVLAGVVRGEAARELLFRTIRSADVFPICSPYMQHYFLEACQACGAVELQRAVIRDYWGGMVRTGASAFYEVFSPDQPFFSPYGDAWANSACHAWSCTPVVYLV
ncbi:MAG: hypothetical protein IJJ33_01660 [Victivallales bacterium]|nr:hypothetical protein [Victivallales bacterium]